MRMIVPKGLRSAFTVSEEKPNILIAVMDAARADHLSCYGYNRNTTPNLDKLAKEGVVYENTYSTAAWTLPSIASMFTSTFPSQHGYYIGACFNKPEEGIFSIIDSEASKKFTFTLADILKSHGYKTVGFSAAPWVNRSTLGQGFEEFYSTADDVEQVNKKVISWLENYQAPFFMYVHYYDPHAPFTPKDRYQKLLLKGKKLRKEIDSSLIKKYIAGVIELSKEELDTMVDLYDAELRELDDGISKVIEYLKRNNQINNTVIIITADHGENLGEHHLMGHCWCLYDTLIHIPLIIRYPKLFPQGTREENLVQNLDVFPTIIGLLNIDFKEKGKLQGQSLLPTKEKRVRQFVFGEFGGPVESLEKSAEKYPDKFVLPKPDRKLKFIRSLEYKYIWSSDGKDELYNIKEDPQELHNLIKEMPKKAKKMRKELERWFDSFEKRDLRRPICLDEEIKEKLRALGYIQ